MYSECHMHIFMNGKNYKEAVALHRAAVQDGDIRCKLAAYAAAGVGYLRDGGDALGVSERAAQLAPEYGLTYRTPIFAIHKNHCYGGIVGKGFDDMRGYHALVKQAAARGADFIKIMISGIMDFAKEGALTEPSLPQAEIREMIHIAHEEGFAVMAHTNGAEAALAAIEAGADTLEHGNFMDEDCLQALRMGHTIWVPTFVTITSLIGCGRFDDSALRRLKERQGAVIRRGFAYGVSIAPGSDAGAYMVPHAQGIQSEYRELYELCKDIMTEAEFRVRMDRAAGEIAQRFQRA